MLLKGDGSEPELKKSNPLLGIHHRVSITDPAKTERLTAPFARLFNPVLVVAVTAAFLWLTWWLLLDKGLASATHDAFHRPGLLLAVFLVTVLSAGFHEFGHAAAARRGGSSPGVMGMGLYLFWPAFYTDVTDSYRLGRVGRLRTDLGGLYFNALVAVGDRRRLVVHPQRRAAAGGGDPDPADAAPAHADDPLRRLPRARGPHRRTGSLPPHQADPARRPAVALARPQGRRAQAVGARRS